MTKVLVLFYQYHKFIIQILIYINEVDYMHTRAFKRKAGKRELEKEKERFYISPEYILWVLLAAALLNARDIHLQKIAHEYSNDLRNIY